MKAGFSARTSVFSACLYGAGFVVMTVISSCGDTDHILLGPLLCLAGLSYFVSPFVFFGEKDAAYVQSC